MILSVRHKFIFIKGMKVAGTSVEMALAPLCGPDDIVTPISPIDEMERLGRGGGCRTGYFPVATGGSGEIATPPPPPPPPPPPQPVVIDVTIAPSACDPTWVCNLVPVDATVVASAVFSINGMTLQVNNADGTVDVLTLDYVNVAPADDDGTLFIVSGGGEVFDAGGNLVKTVSVVVNVAVDEDTAMPSVTGGTLTITIP